MSGKAKEPALVFAQSLTAQPGERPNHIMGTFQQICPRCHHLLPATHEPRIWSLEPLQQLQQKKQTPLHLCLPEEPCGLCLVMLDSACQVWQGYICLAEAWVTLATLHESLGNTVFSFSAAEAQEGRLQWIEKVWHDSLSNIVTVHPFGYSATVHRSPHA